MNTKKLEVKLSKLALEPGDIVIITVPSVTRALKDEIGEHLRRLVGPDYKVIMAQEPVTIELLAERLTAEELHALTVAWERRHPAHEIPTQLADGKWRGVAAGAETSNSKIQTSEAGPRLGQVQASSAKPERKHHDRTLPPGRRNA